MRFVQKLLSKLRKKKVAASPETLLFDPRTYYPSYYRDAFKNAPGEPIFYNGQAPTAMVFPIALQGYEDVASPVAPSPSYDAPYESPPSHSNNDCSSSYSGGSDYSSSSSYDSGSSSSGDCGGGSSSGGGD